MPSRPTYLTFLAAFFLHHAVALLPAQDLVAPTEPLTASEQQKLFHLPLGFEIQLVAAEPDIRKPINLAFDRRGRLYATQSEDYPFPASADATPRDVVKIFSDFNDQGHARHVQTFVDGLNIPIGVLPIEGGVLVYSIPNIYFCPDANRDDLADSRDLFYGTFGVVDTHGMGSSFRQWIDGWIYGCHGFANNSELRGSDGRAISLHSGNTYRLRADGSHVEQWTWGQVNPFGLTFDPLGNLYSSDCHTLPIYMLLRGAYYPSFGKPHDGLGFGPTMLDHLHGSTGIAGIAYYAADHFPAEYRDTIFVGNPVTGRVNHDTLEQHGSTYRALEQPDFIRCDDPWFRPVDVQVGPDGALYIADFYNRIIGHYEVPLTHPGRDRERGRIWRVVYRGPQTPSSAPRQAPDLTQLDGPALVDQLQHPNLVLRTLATSELAARWSADIAEQLLALVTSNAPAPQRAHALWLLERFAALDDDRVRQLADDPQPLVRVHLVKALAERADWSATGLDIAPLVRAKLNDDDPFVRRAAADALGRHPSPENLAPLLALWQQTPVDDTHLIHTIRIALRDHLLTPDRYATADSLASADPDAARRLADVSAGARTAASAEFILRRLESNTADPARLPEFLHHVTRYLDESQLPSLYAHVQMYASADAALQFAVVRALYQAHRERDVPLPVFITEWCQQLSNDLLASTEVDRVRDGIELASDMRIALAFRQLEQLAAPDASFPELRASAVEAGMMLAPPRMLPTLAAILANPAEPMELRQRVASILGNTNVEGGAAVLLEQLPTAPERLAIEIAAALAGSHAGADSLLLAIAEGKASPRLLQNRNVELRLRTSQRSGMDERIRELTANLPTADERIVQLISQRRDGYATAELDLARGREVFLKTCSACHRLAGQGAKIGPELDGVGQRGLERLLEDVLDPSRNVDQAFRSTLLTTSDGRVLSGLVLREEGNVLVLADNQGKEVRVSLDEIDERETSSLSPMPPNVPDLVSETDFYHLIGFLLAQLPADGPRP